MITKIILAYVILALILIFKARKIVKETQRMSVLRLGKFHDFKNPGFHIIIPFIDQVELIDLQKELPGFKGMTSDQIADRIVENRYGKEILDKWVQNNRKPISSSS